MFAFADHLLFKNNFIKKIVYELSCFCIFSERYFEWSHRVFKWGKEITRVRYNLMICDSLGSEEVLNLIFMVISVCYG